MSFFCDLHIHSPFSRATSRQLVPEQIDYWARIKGLTLIGTGDLTHPGWLQELKDKLTPAEPGLFALKQENRLPILPEFAEKPVRFVLTGEISTIYKKNDKVRKIHSVIAFPDFKSAERFNNMLIAGGFNLKSDGRPILGLDVKHLLEISLEADENCMFIPAHIWTPWFSLLGSKSGFTSPDECFDDLTVHITAMETGLSSDIPMNRICSILDRFTLLSHSDAHSLESLGRNANILDCELDYFTIRQSIKEGNDGFIGTVDLFPQEGKYHYDGHRKCGPAMNPLDTLKNNGLCPSCGKPVTVGVLNRIAQISDREIFLPEKAEQKFHFIVPLSEIYSEILGVGKASKKVRAAYERAVRMFGPELDILLHTPVSKIRQAAEDELAEAITNMRERRIEVAPGYDGEYGKVSVLAEQKNGGADRAEPVPFICFDLNSFQKLRLDSRVKHNTNNLDKTPETAKKVNTEQKEAIQSPLVSQALIAGPGTGKTHTLVNRIAFLIRELDVAPHTITALTFTNLAARELGERLKTKGIGVNVGTFHGLGYRVLSSFPEKARLKAPFTVLDSRDQEELISRSLSLSQLQASGFRKKISGAKQNLVPFHLMPQELQEYQEVLYKNNSVDQDDLVYRFFFMLEDPEVRQWCRDMCSVVLVDEFQDLNNSQYQILKALSPPPGPVTCIGDPAQGIYSFRGADPGLVDKFIDEYEAKTVSFTKSYRCSTKILSASSQALAAGSPGQGITGKKQGTEIQVAKQPTAAAEAEYIARTIQNLLGGVSFFSLDSDVVNNQTSEDTGLSDIAILCRLKEQFAVIAKALENHKIPYQVVSRDQITSNPQVATAIKLQNACVVKENLTQSLIRIAREQNIDTTDQVWLRFIALSESYGSDVNRFLRDIKLGQDQDFFQRVEHVKLMTMHASKGLEFPVVFIPGCEEGILPLSLFPGYGIDPLEERRLLYVAMTRASEQLFISYAKQRRVKGITLSGKLSSFVKDISEELVLSVSPELKKEKDKQLSLLDPK